MDFILYAIDPRWIGVIVKSISNTTKIYISLQIFFWNIKKNNLHAIKNIYNFIYSNLSNSFYLIPSMHLKLSLLYGCQVISHLIYQLNLEPLHPLTQDLSPTSSVQQVSQSSTCSSRYRYKQSWHAHLPYEIGDVVPWLLDANPSLIMRVVCLRDSTSMLVTPY